MSRLPNLTTARSIAIATAVLTDRQIPRSVLVTVSYVSVFTPERSAAMENLIIILTHVMAFGAAILHCRTKPAIAQKTSLTVLGVLATPIFWLVLFAMLDFSNHAGNGTHGAWYIILSVVSLGIVPLVTHLSAALSGVVAFRFLGLDRGGSRYKEPFDEDTRNYVQAM